MNEWLKRKGVLMDLKFYIELIKDTSLNQEDLESCYCHIASDITFVENKETDTQCFYLIKDNVMYITFRGTEKKLRDWMTDINAFQQVVPYDNSDSKIRVHQGLIAAYKSVRPRIMEFVRQNNYRINRYKIIGHSLGGGLATLCAVDIQYNITPLISCYTMGSLMVGNKAFVDSYNKRVPDTHRFYIRKDVAQWLPPEFFFKLTGKFCHVKQGVPIGPNDIFCGIKDMIRRKCTTRLLADLANHSMELYEKYLLH